MRISKDDLDASPDIGLTSLAYLIEPFEEALTLKLGQGLAHRFANDLAMADQALIGGIGQLEDMAGFAQQGHETGRLVEHQGQKLMFRGPARFLPVTLGKDWRRGIAVG
ncbi:hypothetical protein MesoLj113b_59840 [Mesorhizobium sp. 113-3-3]|nr:hypothetical protein MesoLj113b_59840 [Mesorhizobium sp. 113-3-3]